VAQRKAKKTWGERLKLSALPKLKERWKDRDGPGNPARMAVNYETVNPPQKSSSFGTVSSQSALAKSMEYAEPWLGTYGRSAMASVGKRGATLSSAKARQMAACLNEAVYEEIVPCDLDALLCVCGSQLTSSYRSRPRLGKGCKRCVTRGRY
jgi:hypothetical protein